MWLRAYAAEGDESQDGPMGKEVGELGSKRRGALRATTDHPASLSRTQTRPCSPCLLER